MLRKVIVGLFCMLVLCFSSTATVYANYSMYDYYTCIKLSTDDNKVSINYKISTIESLPYVKNGRTLVPFRFLGESLGARIFWDASKNKATLKLSNKEVVVVVGSKTAYVNGKEMNLDTPPEIKEGRTFIPLRFVSESLGAYVVYYSEINTVAVSYIDTSDWTQYIDPKTEFTYIHPKDWKVKPLDDVVSFNSPKGAILNVSLRERTTSETRTILKQQAIKNGWNLDDEIAYDKNNPNGDYKLVYSRFNSKEDCYYMYVIYIYSTDSDSYIAELVIKEDDYKLMEHQTMLKIIES